MKRITSLFNRGSDRSYERPRRLVMRSNPSSSQASAPPKIQQWAWKQENTYGIDDVSFLPNRTKYKIWVSFEGEGARKMKLLIDDDVICEADTNQTKRGVGSFTVDDGIIVDFFWDLVAVPKHIRFGTREAVAAGSGGGGDGVVAEPTPVYYVQSVEMVFPSIPFVV